MSATIPPSPRRLAAARMAGSRPRARLWWLAASAGGLALALDHGWPAAAGWLASRMAATVAGHDLHALAPGTVTAAMLGLTTLAGAVVGARALIGEPRTRGEPDLRADIDEISPGLRVALVGLALVTVLGLDRGLFAAASRSADAGIGDPGALTAVWLGSIVRALWALVIVAAGLGVIERLASARQLWHGLHLTPAQARDRARALDRRRP